MVVALIVVVIVTIVVEVVVVLTSVVVVNRAWIPTLHVDLERPQKVFYQLLLWVLLVADVDIAVVPKRE